MLRVHALQLAHFKRRQLIIVIVIIITYQSGNRDQFFSSIVPSEIICLLIVHIVKDAEKNKQKTLILSTVTTR